MADALVFLGGGGEMGALMRAYDWAKSPLGPAQGWPQPLRTVIRLLLNTRHPMFVFWGPEHTCLYNDAYSTLIGSERHPRALGRAGIEVWGEIWHVIGPQIEQVMSGGGATWHRDQLVPITRQGRREDVYWTYSFSPIDEQAAANGIGGVLVVATETTAQVIAGRRHAEWVVVRTAERDRLAQLFEQAPSFMAMLSGPEHIFELANQAYLRLIGHREVLGRSVAAALPEVVEQGYVVLLDEVFQTGRPFTSKGAKYLAQVVPGGPTREHFIDLIYQPIRNNLGEVTGIFVEGADVTGRNLAEEALRTLNETLEQRITDEMAARGKTEEALRQAQKMEAIGQLTGGIAHDFNNMLQAIVSGIELARRRIASGKAEAATDFLNAARESADRAAALTRRLLAFGRRQALNPKPLLPGELIRGIEVLVRRTIGPAIVLDLELQADSWVIHCDPNQLENALLNLAINARDAMLPDGGRLSIGTTQVVLDEADVGGWDGVAPGEYIRITVADTGTGMTPDVLAQAFEPFFTTKPAGQGTGLGLSQLYGFMRQSHGVVRLESKLAAGTSVHLYLPRCHQTPGNAGGSVVAEERLQPARAGSATTVLLVEDEAAIRALMAQALRELGCGVLEAADGPAGLQALHKAMNQGKAGRVDLLITDLGLPGGMNGRRLADAVRELLPDLPVLLITGFAGDAITGQGRLASGMEMLGKPFGLDVLAARVMKMVGRVR